MINKPKDWDSVQAYGESRKAPVPGAYICTVKKAEVIKLSNNSEQLAILYDITEGEFAGYYAEDYATRSNYDKDAKYRGLLKVWLPKDNDTSDLNQNTKARLKGVVTSFEESNEGYHWNWNEQTLKGLKIGILYRNEEWENATSGRKGWKAQPFMALSAKSVREGKYTIPKEKPLSNGSSAPAADYAYQPQQPKFETMSNDEDDLPF